MDKEKLFRDPVHNYIKIPSSLCVDFIDTYLFQRLRAIEQTSMRCLYPGARHDRFIHSLGTYHLATQIYSILEEDIASHVSDQNKLKQIENTFCIAALLHDCAHSPFSHTGEKFTKTYCGKMINDDINKLFNKTDYPKDLSEIKKYPAIHEVASAYVGAKYFSQQLNKNKVNIEQFARMITGVKNEITSTSDIERTVYNFLIPLINGFIIDVDRLDYLLRDTWASGVSNAKVDIVRLLNGIKLNWDTGEIEIKNQSLSSLINAVKARDFIYQWIFPHHKVAYSEYILGDAIEKLVVSMANKNNKKLVDVGKEIFSPERFFSGYTIGNDNIFMPTDGDIIYLIKKYNDDPKGTSAATQVLTRRNHLQPLWKSVPEFTTLFPPPQEQSNLKEFYKVFCGDIQNKINEKFPNRDDFLVLDPQLIKRTEHYLTNVRISVENSKTGLDKIDLQSMLGVNLHEIYYFFVYVPSDISKEDLLKNFNDVYRVCINTYNNI